MQFDWSAIWPAIPLLIEGAKMTLWISVLGLAGGLVIGLLAGFAHLRWLDSQPRRAGLY